MRHHVTGWAFTIAWLAACLAGGAVLQILKAVGWA